MGYGRPKVLMLVLDGLGDWPDARLDNRTPLEAATKPNLDRLAAAGGTGLLHVLGRGRVPGSDVAHLSLFGYDPACFYSGRGPIEARGLGLSLQHGDVALRANIGTVEDGIVIDRRAGRLSDTSGFVKDLDGITIDAVTFVVRPATAHRAVVIMRGEGLSARISDGDPHETGVEILDPQPLDGSDESRRTASVLARFLEKSHRILNESPLNRERKARRQPRANYVLVRGAGHVREVPSFAQRYHDLKAACIAGGGLYRGIGAYLGMDVLSVDGANGGDDTDVRAKIGAARRALDAYDFVFVHIKGPDILGHDGNPTGKREFIERADGGFQPLVELEDTVLVVTADHSTPCALKNHSADPVPVLFHGPGVRVDLVCTFDERACAQGVLGHFTGAELMPQIMNLLGLLPLEGA